MKFNVHDFCFPDGEERLNWRCFILFLWLPVLYLSLILYMAASGIAFGIHAPKKIWEERFE